MKRRIVIHCESRLRPVVSQVESALVRYLNDEIVGIIDKNNAGKTVQDVLGFGGAIPVTSTLDELFTRKPNYLLLGASSLVPAFPMEWYPMVIQALQNKVHVLNGLHQTLNDLAEFELLSEKYKARIIDLRRDEEKNRPLKFIGPKEGKQSKRILISGGNRYSGKLVTSIELTHALHKKGTSADWLPTSLAGYLLKGKGLTADSMGADIIAGHVENELNELNGKFEYLLVQGQGAFTDPVKAPASLGILHGSQPDGVIMCYRLEQANDLRGALRALELQRMLLEQVNGAQVLAVSINLAQLPSSEDRGDVISRLKQQLGLPVADPLGGGINVLLDSIALKK